MSHAPSEALERRHAAVREQIDAASLDALVVTSLSNINYLTNFTGQRRDRRTHVRCRCTFLTDSRYVTTVSQNQADAVRVPWISNW